MPDDISFLTVFLCDMEESGSAEQEQMGSCTLVPRVHVLHGILLGVLACPGCARIDPCKVYVSVQGSGHEYQDSQHKKRDDWSGPELGGPGVLASSGVVGRGMKAVHRPACLVQHA